MMSKGQGVGSAGPVIPTDIHRPDIGPLPPAPRRISEVNQLEALSSVQWHITPSMWGSSSPLAMWQGVKVEDEHVVEIELEGFVLRTGEMYSTPDQSKLHLMVESGVVLYELCQTASRRLGQRRSQP